MASSVKNNLGLALRMLLKPLVRLLVSQGITHAEFSEISKDVYVETAIRYFSDKTEKKKVNKSRIAIVTGLTRKEVANVIGRAISSATSSKEFSRPSRVLSGWHTDPAYVGPYGLPLEIPWDTPGQTGEAPSFIHLVRTYSGDMAPKPMFEELLRGGAIVKQDNGAVKVIRRDFEPRSLSPQLIERFGDVGFNFISTISANVEKEVENTGLFDRVVFSDNPLTREELSAFDKYLKEQGQAFLEQVDNWFSLNIAKKKSEGEETFDSGVAMVQYIEREPDSKKSLRDYLISVDYPADSGVPLDSKN